MSVQSNVYATGTLNIPSFMAYYPDINSPSTVSINLKFSTNGADTLVVKPKKFDPSAAIVGISTFRNIPSFNNPVRRLTSPGLLTINLPNLVYSTDTLKYRMIQISTTSTGVSLFTNTIQWTSTSNTDKAEILILAYHESSWYMESIYLYLSVNPSISYGSFGNSIDLQIVPSGNLMLNLFNNLLSITLASKTDPDTSEDDIFVRITSTLPSNPIVSLTELGDLQVNMDVTCVDTTLSLIVFDLGDPQIPLTISLNLKCLSAGKDPLESIEDQISGQYIEATSIPSNEYLKGTALTSSGVYFCSVKKEYVPFGWLLDYMQSAQTYKISAFMNTGRLFWNQNKIRAAVTDCEGKASSTIAKTLNVNAKNSVHIEFKSNFQSHQGGYLRIKAITFDLEGDPVAELGFLSNDNASPYNAIQKQEANNIYYVIQKNPLSGYGNARLSFGTFTYPTFSSSYSVSSTLSLQTFGPVYIGEKFVFDIKPLFSCTNPVCNNGKLFYTYYGTSDSYVMSKKGIISWDLPNSNEISLNFLAIDKSGAYLEINFKYQAQIRTVTNAACETYYIGYRSAPFSQTLSNCFNNLDGALFNAKVTKTYNYDDQEVGDTNPISSTNLVSLTIPTAEQKLLSDPLFIMLQNKYDNKIKFGIAICPRYEAIEPKEYLKFTAGKKNYMSDIYFNKYYYFIPVIAHSFTATSFACAEQGSNYFIHAGLAGNPYGPYLLNPSSEYYSFTFRCIVNYVDRFSIAQSYSYDWTGNIYPRKAPEITVSNTQVYVFSKGSSATLKFSINNPNTVSNPGTHTFKSSITPIKALLTTPISTWNDPDFTITIDNLNLHESGVYDFVTVPIEICVWYVFKIENQVDGYETLKNCIIPTIEIKDSDNMYMPPVFLFPVPSALIKTRTYDTIFTGDWVYNPVTAGDVYDLDTLLTFLTVYMDPVVSYFTVSGQELRWTASKLNQAWTDNSIAYITGGAIRTSVFYNIALYIKDSTDKTAYQLFPVKALGIPYIKSGTGCTIFDNACGKTQTYDLTSCIYDESPGDLKFTIFNLEFSYFASFSFNTIGKSFTFLIPRDKCDGGVTFPAQKFSIKVEDKDSLTASKDITINVNNIPKRTFTNTLSTVYNFQYGAWLYPKTQRLILDSTWAKSFLSIENGVSDPLPFTFTCTDSKTVDITMKYVYEARYTKRYYISFLDTEYNQEKKFYFLFDASANAIGQVSSLSSLYYAVNSSGKYFPTKANFTLKFKRKIDSANQQEIAFKDLKNFIYLMEFETTVSGKTQFLSTSDFEYDFTTGKATFLIPKQTPEWCRNVIIFNINKNCTDLLSLKLYWFYSLTETTYQYSETISVFPATEIILTPYPEIVFVKCPSNCNLYKRSEEKACFYTINDIGSISTPSLNVINFLENKIKLELVSTTKIAVSIYVPESLTNKAFYTITFAQSEYKAMGFRINLFGYVNHVISSDFTPFYPQSNSQTTSNPTVVNSYNIYFPFSFDLDAVRIKQLTTFTVSGLGSSSSGISSANFFYNQSMLSWGAAYNITIEAKLLNTSCSSQSVANYLIFTPQGDASMQIKNKQPSEFSAQQSQVWSTTFSILIIKNFADDIKIDQYWTNEVKCLDPVVQNQIKVGAVVKNTDQIYDVKLEWTPAVLVYTSGKCTFYSTYSPSIKLTASYDFIVYPIKVTNSLGTWLSPSYKNSLVSILKPFGYLIGYKDDDSPLSEHNCSISSISEASIKDYFTFKGPCYLYFKPDLNFIRKINSTPQAYELYISYKDGSGSFNPTTFNIELQFLKQEATPYLTPESGDPDDMVYWDILDFPFESKPQLWMDISTYDMINDIYFSRVFKAISIPEDLSVLIVGKNRIQYSLYDSYSLNNAYFYNPLINASISSELNGVFITVVKPICIINDCKERPSVNSVECVELCDTQSSSKVLNVKQGGLIKVYGINLIAFIKVWIGAISVSDCLDNKNDSSVSTNIRVPIGRGENILVRVDSYEDSTCNQLKFRGYPMMAITYILPDPIINVMEGWSKSTVNSSEYYQIFQLGDGIKIQGENFQPELCFCQIKIQKISDVWVNDPLEFTFYDSNYISCGSSKLPSKANEKEFYPFRIACYTASDINPNSLTLIYSNEITFIIFIGKDLSLSRNIDDGHNHGGYNIEYGFNEFYFQTFEFEVQKFDKFYSLDDRTFLKLTVKNETGDIDEIRGAPVTTITKDSFIFIFPGIKLGTIPSSSTLAVSIDGGRNFISEANFNLLGVCNKGYYCSSNLIKICPAGSECPKDPTSGLDVDYNKNPISCVPGKYSSIGASSCLICPLGAYCPFSGTEVPVPCDLGWNCDEKGLEIPNKRCLGVGGYICLKPGIIDYNRVYDPDNPNVPKPAKNSESDGPDDKKDILFCPEYYYCFLSTNSTELDETTQFLVTVVNFTEKYDSKMIYTAKFVDKISNPHLCKSTEICPRGSPFPRINNPCVEGQYCPSQFCSKDLTFESYDEGAIYCRCSSINVPIISSASCKCVGIICTCLRGHICEKTRLEKPTKCPVGKYNDEYGKRYISDCKPCLVGYACSKEAIRDVSEMTPCDKGTYCPSGTDKANNCGRGYYQDEIQQEACKMCPPGLLCGNPQNDRPKECPSGYYCPPGTGESVECPPGFWCPANSTYVNEIMGLSVSKLYEKLMFIVGKDESKITSEFLDIEFPNNDYIKKLIIAYKSATPATRIEPFQNVTIFLWDRVRAVAAPLYDLITNFSFYYVINHLTIDKSLSQITYYSVNLSDPTTYPFDNFHFSGDTSIKLIRICEKGFYCPKRSSVQLACPPGKYNDLKGQDKCKSCPAGYFCNAAIETMNRTLDDGTQEEIKIDRKVTPKICPAGMVCNKAGLGVPATPCPAGFYCLEGTLTEDPLDVDTQLRPYACPVGTYCQEKTGSGMIKDGLSGYPQNCAIGTFSNDTGQYQCKNCEAGYECIKKGMSNIESNKCLPGFYRTWSASQIECLPCPEGTYSEYFGLKSDKDCTPCIAGRVCKKEGLASPTYDDKGELVANCSKGFVCPAHTGKSNETAIPCPTNYFCYEGTPSIEDAMNNPCPRGRTCKLGTSSEGPYEYMACMADDLPATINNCQIGSICSQNYFCPEGTGDKGIPCPAGRNSDFGSWKLIHCKRTIADFDKSISIQDPIVISPKYTFQNLFFYVEFSTIINTFMAKQSYYNPEDFQILMKIEKFSSSENDVKNTTYINFVKPDYLGSRTQIPIFLSFGSYYSESTFNIIMSTASNLKFSILIDLLENPYLNVNLLQQPDSSSTSLKSSRNFSEAFIFVQILNYQVQSTTGQSKTEDREPALNNNVFNLFYINSDTGKFERNYKSYYFGNDFSFTSGAMYDHNNYTSSSDLPQYKDFRQEYYIPQGLKGLKRPDQYWTWHIPYIANCEEFGAQIPFEVLISKDSGAQKCKKSNDPRTVNFLLPWLDPRGDTCNFKMTCLLDETFSVCSYRPQLNSSNLLKKKWYDPEYAEPVFFISRGRMGYSDFIEKNPQNESTPNFGFPTSDIIPVMPINLQPGAVSGMVPKNVTFKIYYTMDSNYRKEILKSFLYFDKYVSGRGLSSTESLSFELDKEYNLHFVFQPATWTDKFDLLDFPKAEVNLLHFIICIIYAIPALIYYGLSKMYKVRLLKKAKVLTKKDHIENIKAYLSFVVHFFNGTMLVLIPISCIMPALYYFFMNVELSKTFNANSDESNENLTQAQMTKYRNGRMGTALIAISLFITNEIINITIPNSHEADFKNDENIAHVKEKGLILQRKKGSFTWILFSMVLVFSFIEAISVSPLADGLYSAIYIFFVKVVLQKIAVWRASNLDDELIVVFVRGIVDISSSIIAFHLKSYSDMVIIFLANMMYDALDRFALGILEKKISAYLFKSAPNEASNEQVNEDEYVNFESDEGDDEHNKPVYNKISILLLYSMASNLQDIFILTFISLIVYFTHGTFFTFISGYYVKTDIYLLYSFLYFGYFITRLFLDYFYLLSFENFLKKGERGLFFYLKECMVLYKARKTSWVLFDPSEKRKEFSSVPQRFDKLHRLGLSSQFFFLKGFVSISVFFMIFGFKGWMQKELQMDFVPFKDVFIMPMLVCFYIIFFISKIIFTKIGNILRVWHLKGEKLLIKTKAADVKSRADLIRILYAERQQVKNDVNKNYRFETSGMLVDSIISVLSTKVGQEERKKTLFKLIEEVNIAKYVRFDEIMNAIELERKERMKQKIDNLNKDVIEMASELTIDYIDKNWPTEMIFDWGTSVSLSDNINLKDKIEKMNATSKVSSRNHSKMPSAYITKNQSRAISPRHSLKKMSPRHSFIKVRSPSQKNTQNPHYKNVPENESFTSLVHIHEERKTDNPYEKLDMSSRREFDQSERSAQKLIEEENEAESPNISVRMEKSKIE